MFGIQDSAIWVAYVLCILATGLCVVYGLLNWNRGEKEPDAEDVAWEREEKEVDEAL